VLTPVRNPDPVFLRRTLASVLSQSLTDFEHVLVEDPSPRSAGPIVAEFADGRIRHVANPTRTSLLKQRNRSLQEAKGEFIALIDADDECEPGRLAAQVEFLRANPEVDVVGSQLTIIDAEHRPLGVRDYPLTHRAIASAMPRVSPIAQPSVMARTAAMLDVGGYAYARYNCCEDYELWCRMLRRGKRFANLPERLTRYRIQPQQLKSERLRDTIRGTLEIKRMHFPEDRAFASLLRRYGEALLLRLPPAMVLKLFLRLTVKQQR